LEELGGQVVAPVWLTAVAWLYLSVCFCCAGIIAYDIALNRRRQPMGVMNFVFPITALYLGPVALALYWRWARSAIAGPHGTHEPAPPDERARPGWGTIAIEVSHCGAGCTLGDVISEFGIFGLGLTIAGLALGAEYVGDYVLALAFGIVFQYFAIAPMRGLGLKDGLIAAAKADVISLTAFEIGLFGWMAIMAFVLFPAPHHLMPSSVAYWLLMQIGMMIGYFTSWPANVWLINRGIKVPM
jgi:hypothetical protein